MQKLKAKDILYSELWGSLESIPNLENHPTDFMVNERGAYLYATLEDLGGRLHDIVIYKNLKDGFIYVSDIGKLKVC